MGAPYGYLDTVSNYPDVKTRERLKELDSLGVDVVEEGEALVNGRKVLGKGSRSLVVAGMYRGRKVAVKIRRADSPRTSVLHEATVLLKTNLLDIGPRFLACTKNFLVMDIVRGVPLSNHTDISDAELKKCVGYALWQARQLDFLRVDHGELSRPGRHVYCCGGRAVVLDFDSASFRRKPHNFNSLYSALYVKPGALRRRLLGLE